jgi:hypothetical protein
VLTCDLPEAVLLPSAQSFCGAVWLVSAVPNMAWSFVFIQFHRQVLLAGIPGWLVGLALSPLTLGLLLD